jgi:hypothetical protein
MQVRVSCPHRPLERQAKAVIHRLPVGDKQLQDVAARYMYMFLFFGQLLGISIFLCNIFERGINIHVQNT